VDDEVFYPVDEATKILKLTPGRIRQMLREGSPEGFSLFSRATSMASKGLRPGRVVWRRSTLMREELWRSRYRRPG
jgi:hypothetical protein